MGPVYKGFHNRMNYAERMWLALLDFKLADEPLAGIGHSSGIPAYQKSLFLYIEILRT